MGDAGMRDRLDTTLSKLYQNLHDLLTKRIATTPVGGDIFLDRVAISAGEWVKSLSTESSDSQSSANELELEAIRKKLATAEAQSSRLSSELITAHEQLQLQLDLVNKSPPSTAGTPREQLRARIDLAQERAADEHKLRLHAERRVASAGDTGQFGAEAVKYLAETNDQMQGKIVQLEKQIKAKNARGVSASPNVQRGVIAGSNSTGYYTTAASNSARVRRKKPSFDAESPSSPVSSSNPETAAPSSRFGSAHELSGKQAPAKVVELPRNIIEQAIETFMNVDTHGDGTVNQQELFCRHGGWDLYCEYAMDDASKTITLDEWIKFLKQRVASVNHEEGESQGGFNHALVEARREVATLVSALHEAQGTTTIVQTKKDESDAVLLEAQSLARQCCLREAQLRDELSCMAKLETQHREEAAKYKALLDDMQQANKDLESRIPSSRFAKRGSSPQKVLLEQKLKTAELKTAQLESQLKTVTQVRAEERRLLSQQLQSEVAAREQVESAVREAKTKQEAKVSELSEQLGQQAASLKRAEEMKHKSSLGEWAQTMKDELVGDPQQAADLRKQIEGLQLEIAKEKTARLQAEQQVTLTAKVSKTPPAKVTVTKKKRPSEKMVSLEQLQIAEQRVEEVELLLKNAEAEAKRSASLQSWAEKLEEELDGSVKPPSMESKSAVQALQAQLRAEIAARQQIEKSATQAKLADAQRIELLTVQLDKVLRVSTRAEPESDSSSLKPLLEKVTDARKQSELAAAGVKRRLEARIMELNQRMTKEVSAREAAELGANKAQHRNAERVEELTQQLQEALSESKKVQSVAASSATMRKLEEEVEERVAQLQKEIRQRQQAEAIGMEQQSKALEHEARASTAVGALRAVEEQNVELGRKCLALKIELQASENSVKLLQERLQGTQLELSESWVSSDEVVQLKQVNTELSGQLELEMERAAAGQNLFHLSEKREEKLGDRLKGLQGELFDLQQGALVGINETELKSLRESEAQLREQNSRLQDRTSELQNSRLQDRMSELQKAATGGISESDVRILRDNEAQLVQENSRLQEKLRETRNEMLENQKAGASKPEPEGKLKARQDRLIQSLNAELLDLQKDVLRLETLAAGQAKELEQAEAKTNESAEATAELAGLKKLSNSAEFSNNILQKKLSNINAEVEYFKANEKRLGAENARLQDHLKESRNEMFDLQKATVLMRVNPSKSEAEREEQPNPAQEDGLIRSLNAEVLDLQKDVLRLETLAEGQAKELEQAQMGAGMGAQMDVKTELEEAKGIISRLQYNLKETRQEVFDIQQATLFSHKVESDAKPPENTGQQDGLIRSLNAEVLDLQKDVLRLETLAEIHAKELEQAQMGAQMGAQMDVKMALQHATTELEGARRDNESFQKASRGEIDRMKVRVQELEGELKSALARESKLKNAIKETRGELFEVQQAYARSTE